MSDVHSDNTSQQETPAAAITGSSTEEMVRESVRQLNKQREEQGTAEVDAFRANEGDREPAPLSYQDNEEKTLKQVTEDTTNYHKTNFGKDYFKSYGFDVPDEYAREVADEAAALGRKPSEAPHYKVPVVGNAGNVVPPLRDYDRVFDLSQDQVFKNYSEMRKSMQNFRDAQRAEQQALLTELQRAQEQQAAQPTQQAAPVQQQQPQSVEPSQPVEQSPQAQPDDALAQERAALQQQRAEAAAIADHARWSAAERQTASAIRQLDAWAQSQADLQDAQILAAMHERAQRGDQASIKRLAQIQKAFENRQALAQKFAEYNSGRVTRELAINQHMQAQRQQQIDRYNAEQDELFRKSAPEMDDPRQAAELRKATKELFSELGFTEAELKRAWQNGSIRDHRIQLLLRDAARGRIQEARLRDLPKELASHRQPLPPVQRPGVYRAPGSAAEGDVRALQRQLEQATGNQSLRLAAQLTRAKRAAGQL